MRGILNSFRSYSRHYDISGSGAENSPCIYSILMKSDDFNMKIMNPLVINLQNVLPSELHEFVSPLYLSTNWQIQLKAWIQTYHHYYGSECYFYQVGFHDYVGGHRSPLLIWRTDGQSSVLVLAIKLMPEPLPCVWVKLYIALCIINKHAPFMCVWSFEPLTNSWHRIEGRQWGHSLWYYQYW